jgi:hypothetical protein
MPLSSHPENTRNWLHRVNSLPAPWFAVSHLMRTPYTRPSSCSLTMTGRLPTGPRKDVLAVDEPGSQETNVRF